MTDETCLICGKDAELHHARSHDFSQGKGSGGTALSDAEWQEHNHLAPLCRAHHSLVHAKTLVVTVTDGIATWEMHGEKGTRALVVWDSQPQEVLQVVQLPHASDLTLATLWAAGEAYGQRGVIMQALSAWGFRQRYGWGDRWWERAAEYIRDQTGRMLSPSAVYGRAAIGCFLAALPEGTDYSVALGEVGLTLAGTLGTSPKQEEAIEYAQSRRADGERALVVAREIREKFSGNSEKARACDAGPHRCRFCGKEFSE